MVIFILDKRPSAVINQNQSAEKNGGGGLQPSDWTKIISTTV